MWKRIKKMLATRKQRKEYIQLLQEQARLINESDEEWKTLSLLRSLIYRKHH